MNTSTDNYEKHKNETQGDYAVKKNRRFDIVAFAACIVAAVIFWLYVMNVDSPQYETTFTSIPVTLENASSLASEKGLSVISGSGNVVDIKIKGKKSDIGKYSSSDIVAYVDLDSITESGRHTLDVMVNLPSGLTVSSVTPSSIRVYLDNDETKTVPVVARLSSYILDSSYSLGTLVPEVDEVVVRGPKQVVDGITYALVELSLDTITESISVKGQVQLVDADYNVVDNQYVKCATQSVLVSVPVYAYKEVPLTISYKYGYFTSDNASVTITPSSIKLRGDPKTLDAVNSINIQTVDEKKVGISYKQSVSITLPSGVTATDKTESAVIEIMPKYSAIKTVTISKFSVINPNNSEYEILTGSLNISMRCPTDYLSILTEDRVTVTVDLTYYKNPGTQSIPVTVSVISALDGKVYEIGDYSVDVRIK